MTPFPPKTPMQMGLLKQRPPQHSSPPLTPEQKRHVEAARPVLGSDNDLDEEQTATAHWLAHIEAGRIPVR